MSKLKSKRAPSVDSNQRAWTQVYDDLNDVIKAVNQESGVESRDGASGKDGDIRLFKDVDRNKFFIEGRFSDGWAKRELLFSDTSEAGQDESINFSATESYIKPDGSVPFTGTQIGITPTNNNHLTTKQYVDNLVATEDTLSELNDTNITNVANGNMLKYDSGSSKWINFAANFITSYAVNDSYTGSSLNPAVFGLKQTGTTNVTTLRGVRSANNNMTITLEESVSDGAYLKFNVASPTGIQSVQGYDQLSGGYASAISNNTNLKFADAYNTGNSTGIFFTVTDSGNDTIVTPTIAFPPDVDTNTTYTTSWVDSGNNAILRLTAGGSGSGNDDLTLIAGSNIFLTPSGDNLTIAANNTTNYSLDNASGLPTGTQTLVMLNSGTQGIIRGIKPGNNITMSTTDSDSDTGYITINASLTGATITTQEANPLGGWLSQTTSTLRFIDNGKITWAIGSAGNNTTTVTPTIASYSAADVGAISTGHAANNITSSHITVLGNTSGTNTGDVCSTNHTSAGYLTSNQTINLGGDVSGSGTTNITVTINDDSHNHTIANVDNLQSSLNAKANLSGATFSGDVVAPNIKSTTSGHLKAVAGTSAHRSGLSIYNSAESGYLSYTVTTDGHSSGWGWELSNQSANATSPTYSVRVDYSGSTMKVKGDVIAYVSSDPKLKTNKELIDNPLDKVMQLGGYSFDWKKEATKHGNHLVGHDYGVMADEVEALFPELVTVRENDGETMKAVDYKKLIPLLIESVKELNRRINEKL